MSQHGSTVNQNGNLPGPAPNTAGPHKSDILNKLDPRVDSDGSKLHHNTATTGYHTTGAHNTGAGGLTGSSHTGTREGEHGPHGSRMANAADPRVDSDRDGSHRNAGAGGLTGAGNMTHTTGTAHTGTHREGQHGPHSSKVANAMDPRVDSDRDGSHHTTTGAGMTGGVHSSGLTGTGAGHHSSGLTGTTGTHTSTGMGTGSSTEGAYGPHSSRMANAADPRVDSDRDGSHNMSSSTHTAPGSGPVHNSKIANTLDPRVDSNAANSSMTSGTAGPHGSNMANKMDPRVESQPRRF